MGKMALQKRTTWPLLRKRHCRLHHCNNGHVDIMLPVFENGHCNNGNDDISMPIIVVIFQENKKNAPVTTNLLYY